MTFKAIVRQDGSIQLGAQALSKGYAPGTVVEIIVASSGSLFIAIDTSAPPIDARCIPVLRGGAEQLAARQERRRVG